MQPDELVTRLSKAIDNDLLGFPQSRRPFDVERMANLIATFESAQFFLDHMRMAPNLVTQFELLDFALEQATLDGLTLEFGVATGKTLAHIAQRINGTVFGFDSFDGLPEDWTHFQKQGRYSRSGQPPTDLPANVELIIGLFEQTLPEFLVERTAPASFVHVDSDLYSSARTILTQLTARIVPGTIIVFDEYFIYPAWQDHEHQAFQEFVAKNQNPFEYLGFASSHHSVAVKIL